MEQLKYLKPNVVIEPLFDRWYAWTHLVSPATASRNITERHLKIMSSYIESPHMHAQAIKSSKMRGGPFMDLPENAVEKVETLKKETETKQKNLIQLSRDIDALNKMLQTKARGYSLESLYPEIPEGLKGYVELVYDLNNNPSFRFFESLLYESPYYDASSQSLALWLTNNDERPFVLSTPRVDDENVIHVQTPFSHPVIDLLGSMKRKAGSVLQLCEFLKIPAHQLEQFQSFFTADPPPAYEPYQGDKIRMRYFGHACILIETKNVSILVDPVISYYGYEQEISRFSDMHLPDVIDYVVITHNHQDHILFETLLPLRHKIRNIVVPRGGTSFLQDPSLKLLFNHIGFKNVIELGEMEKILFDDCCITGIPFTGEHGDLCITTKLCYHIRIDGFSLMFMADSNVIEPRLYDHVSKSIGKIDVIFLGMECDGAPLSWLYGPLLHGPLPRDKDATRRFSGCDFERAKALLDIFTPSEVYVYAMGQEPWIEFISSIKYTDQSNPIVQSGKLIGYCISSGILAERLFGEKEILYDRKKSPQVISSVS